MEDSNEAPVQPEELCYLDRYRVLVCIPCKTAIRPGRNGGTHFRNTHQWTKERLQRALSYISTLRLEDPHQIELPRKRSDPIPQLAILKGFSYLGCDYLTINRKNIINHCSKTPYSTAGERWRGVELQTFSQGRYARYWIVGPDAIKNNQEEGNGIDKNDQDRSRNNIDRWEDMLDRYNAAVDKDREKRLRTVDNPAGVENVSIWVREMGWARHLEGKDLTDLY